MTTKTPSSTSEVRTTRHLQESGVLLETIQSYLAHAMQDAQDDVEALSGLFGELYNRMQPVDEDNIPLSHQEIAQRLRKAILHLQFFDRLFQRMTHVQATLADYHQLLRQPDVAWQEEQWSGLWERLRHNDTGAEDNRLLTGYPSDENGGGEAKGDDIEIF